MNDEGAPGGSGRTARRRGPRKVTAQYLENSAAHYLGRFAASSAHLRGLMMQKVRRSHAHHGTDLTEGERMVDALIEKFQRLGFLDDTRYAEMRARGLFAKGTPLRGIRYKLQASGVAEDDIETGLRALADEAEAGDLDLAAALRLARRRRLGPYRGDDAEVRAARRERDLATLARAGFSYDVALRVIDAADIADLEYAAGSEI